MLCRWRHVHRQGAMGRGAFVIDLKQGVWYTQTLSIDSVRDAASEPYAFFRPPKVRADD